MHLYSVISLTAQMWLLPALVCFGLLYLLEPRVWGRRQPRRWWFYVVALLIGAAFTATLPSLIERLHLDALGVWPMLTVPVAALWQVFYSAKRSVDPFYCTLCVVSGSCLFVAIDSLMTGPGDGSDTWSVGLFFSWWFLGVPLAIIAFLQTLVWVLGKIPGSWTK
ncbi:hypothetical protein CKALI_10130 [Corynebacterium kalinowskii]|uniref:Uncharacterized protein n=1 Tax=Corynebacterium kalinowskii TaxID=2675216 RepID=A0A6B8VSL0_9CORY|nr:hypothetical protein [Corynebacterium kalinowskii]QGU02881.1 hypothetical protein CKALI_10130 [Corynebacterium kalinowskii]